MSEGTAGLAIYHPAAKTGLAGACCRAETEPACFPFLSFQNQRALSAGNRELLHFDFTQKVSKENSKNEDHALNSPDIAEHSPLARLTEFRKSKYFWKGQANDFVF